MCKEDTNIELQDGRHTIFVNATGVTDNQKLQEFLEYIKSGTVSNSSFIKKLDQEVKINSSNATWKEKYNMLLAREEMLREEGLKEGREKQYHFILKMIKSNQLSYESCVENVEDKDDFVAWYQEHK